MKKHNGKMKAEPQFIKPETCAICKKEVVVMCFRRTGVCSELCRKKRDGEEPTRKALTDAPIGGER